jgi:hypothetical protein
VEEDEVVSSEEMSMNQLNTSEEKLFARCTPKRRRRSDEKSSDDDDF